MLCCKQRINFPHVEVIAALACAAIYTLTPLTVEIIYQIVSEAHNFTANNSVKYCVENQTTSDEDEIVAREVSQWTMYVKVATYVASAVSSVISSSLSDKIGRRPVLALIMLGVALACATNVCVVIFGLPKYFLVIQGFLLGAFGAYPALMNVSSAHLSDTIPEKDRAKRFTVLEVCASLGGGIVLFGTGYWISADGFVPTAIFLLGCSFVGLFLVYFIPTASADGATNTIEACVNDNEPIITKPLPRNGPIATFTSQMKVVWKIYTTEKSVCTICEGVPSQGLCPHGGGIRKGRVWRLWFYVLSFSLYMFAVNGLQTFQTMFFVSYPICFTPDLVGQQSGFESITTVFAPFFVWFYQSVLRFSNQTILLTGIFSRMVTSVMMFFARGVTLVFSATSVAIFSNLTTGLMRTQVSTLVSSSEQGSAFAVLSGTESLINIFSPVTFLKVYPATLYISYGFTWLIIAAVFCIPFLLMTFVYVADKRKAREIRSENDRESLLQ